MHITLYARIMLTLCPLWYSTLCTLYAHTVLTLCTHQPSLFAHFVHTLWVFSQPPSPFFTSPFALYVHNVHIPFALYVHNVHILCVGDHTKFVHIVYTLCTLFASVGGVSIQANSLVDIRFTKVYEGLDTSVCAVMGSKKKKSRDAHNVRYVHMAA